jgi:hypothetical protein
MVLREPPGSPSSLYNSFPPAEARRIPRRLEFRHTPKHASWPNMVEIEIGVLRTQCLDRRIDNQDLLISEVVAWGAAETTAPIASTGCSPPKGSAKNSPRPMLEAKEP